MFGSSVRTTSFTGLTNCSGSPLDRSSRTIRATGCWASGMYTKSIALSKVSLILDRLRDADDLDRRAGAAIEPDAFAHRVGVRPVVFRELLVDDGDTRRIRGIGRQEAAAAQDRDPHRLEVPFVDGVHRRREALAIARHLKALRHEGDAVEVVQSERRVLRESRALNAGRFSRTRSARSL